MWQAAAQLIRPSNLDRVESRAREPDDLGFDDLIGVGILGKFDTTIFDLLSTGSTESLAYYLLPGNFDIRCARFIASRCTHLSYHFRQQCRDHPVAHRFARSYADVETATPELIRSTMPLRSLLMFVALIGLATFAVIEYMKVGSLNAELNSLKGKPAPRARQVPRAQQRIICPLCDGEKVVVYNPSNNPLYRKTQTCPVCLGIGYRMLTIPSGMKICPDCHGMGLLYIRAQSGLAAAGPCARCSSTGLVADVQ